MNPFIGCIQADESIHYAITVGEPQLVPSHITNVIDIGNRIIDISTVNELCEYFHLPTSLSARLHHLCEQHHDCQLTSAMPGLHLFERFSRPLSAIFP